MERVRASGGGLAAEGRRLNLARNESRKSGVGLHPRRRGVFVFYQKKDMMIPTKGTSWAISARQ